MVYSHNGKQGKESLEMSHHTRMQWETNVQMENMPPLRSHMSMFSSRHRLLISIPRIGRPIVAA